ncbi:MAG: hypothetical protein AAGA22_04535, partial [Pseudomonadota bacterium]
MAVIGSVRSYFNRISSRSGIGLIALSVMVFGCVSDPNLVSNEVVLAQPDARDNREQQSRSALKTYYADELAKFQLAPTRVIDTLFMREQAFRFMFLRPEGDQWLISA